MQNFSVTVPAGEVYAFVGTVSSGRDNIPLLLKRLYRPDQGSIYIDDIKFVGDCTLPPPIHPNPIHHVQSWKCHGLRMGLLAR